MVVDDEEAIRKVVKNILEKEGYTAIGAEDGETCLDLLNKQEFDLIILDVMMPEMSGWDVLTEILRTKKKYKKKIIFLSVVEVSEERRRALIKSGVFDYITKPFNTNDFVKRVKKALK